MIEFGNVVTAMVTPFSVNGDVDYQAAVRLADYLVNNGTQTVLLAGTTGECPTLTHDEEYELFKVVVDAVKGKALVMAGTGSNSTKTAILSSQKAAECGVDALLQVVPYYNKPSQEGIFQHFKLVSESTNLPIMLYNIPGRTGVNMQPETIARCAGISSIVAIKESAGSVEQMKAIKDCVPDDFLIYSGDDGCTLDFLAAGAVGVVSVASHCVGNQINQLIETFKVGNHAEATRIHHELAALFDVLFITSNPAPVKYALSLMGHAVGSLRLPLIPVNAAEQTQIKQVLLDLNVISS